MDTVTAEKEPRVREEFRYGERYGELLRACMSFRSQNKRLAPSDDR